MSDSEDDLWDLGDDPEGGGGSVTQFSTLPYVTSGKSVASPVPLPRPLPVPALLAPVPQPPPDEAPPPPVPAAGAAEAGDGEPSDLDLYTEMMGADYLEMQGVPKGGGPSDLELYTEMMGPDYLEIKGAPAGGPGEGGRLATAQPPKGGSQPPADQEKLVRGVGNGAAGGGGSGGGGGGGSGGRTGGEGGTQPRYTDRRGFPVVFPAPPNPKPPHAVPEPSASQGVQIPPRAPARKPLFPPPPPTPPGEAGAGGPGGSPGRSSSAGGGAALSPPSAGSSPQRPSGSPHESYLKRRGSPDVAYEAKLDGCWWEVTLVPPDEWGVVGGDGGKGGEREGWADPDIGPNRTGAQPPNPGMILVSYYADRTERWWVKPQSELRPRAARGGDGVVDDAGPGGSGKLRVGGFAGGHACMVGPGRCHHKGCRATGRILQREDRPAADGSPSPPRALPGTGLGVVWGSDVMGLDDRSPPPAVPRTAWGPPASTPSPAEAHVELPPPPEPEPPFPLMELDDNVLSMIVPYLGGRELAVVACSCRRFRDLVADADDAVWGHVQLSAGRHPSAPIEGSWRRAYQRGLGIDINWRRRRYSRSESRHHTDYVYMATLMGDHALTASADRSLKLMQMDERSDSADSRAVRAAVADVRGPREQAPGSLTSVMEYNGHSAHATCCAFMPGGLRLLSAATDDELRVWDTATGETIEARRNWTGHKGVVTFCLDPAGERLVAGTSGSCSLGVRVYDVESGACSASAPFFGAEVYGVAAAGPSILGACGDSVLRCWDARSAGLTQTVPASRRGSVRCVSADGDWVATGGADGTVRVFDMRVWRPLRVLPLHSDVVNCVALNRGLGWVLSGGDDCTLVPVRTYSLEPLSPISTRVGVLSCAFDHSRIVAGCEDSAVRMWDFCIEEDHFIDQEALAQVAQSIEIRRRVNDVRPRGSEGESLGGEVDWLRAQATRGLDPDAGVSRKW